MPNTNFTTKKVETDRITERYVWKATRRRLYQHDLAVHRNAPLNSPEEQIPRTRPRVERRIDWPGSHQRPIPDDIHEEETTTAPLLHRSRKRPSLVDLEKDAIDKSRALHNYFFTFLDQAKKYQCFKAEL